MPIKSITSSSSSYTDSDAQAAFDGTIRSPNGLDYNDAAADPAANGEVRRNGTDMKVYSGGAVLNMSNIGSGGSGGLSWSIISTNTTASATNGYLVDVSGGTLTLTLPSSPTEGDKVGVCDFTQNAATNNITIDNNGNNIEGSASNYTISTDGKGLLFVYTNSTRGWEIVSETGGGSTSSDPDFNTVDFTGVYNNGTVSSDTTIDWNNGNYQVITLAADLTLSFTNMGVGNKTLIVKQDGTGGRTLTLPAGEWPDGTADSFSTAANAKDSLSILYDDVDGVYMYQLATAWA